MFLHPPEVHAEITRLAAAGVNDCEIARRLEVGRSTVRDIRSARYVKRGPDARCPRCWRGMKPMSWSGAAYAYVLGLYLGDGCIARNARTYSLRLSLDTKYPGIIAEARAAMEEGFSHNRVSKHCAGERRTVTVLTVYSLHLPCLFPQHGPGKKHDRPIVLEPWQRTIVDAEPWS